MAYQFVAEEAPQYLHAIGTGDRTPENLRRFLIDSHNAAMERRKDRLLLDLHFLGPPLNFGHAYAVIADRSPEGVGFERIAYVDANLERASDDAEFAEMTAQNRGVNVRLFRSVKDATRWLEETRS